MIRPDDDDKPFVARWNTLVRVMLIESSVKLVARTAMDYADLYDGTGVFTGNVRMALGTGYTDKTVRNAWATLRAFGMAERVSFSSSGKRRADVYNLEIPDDWQSKPMLGPHEGQFRCVQCGKLFIPSNSAMELRKDGSVGWYVDRLVFCPAPRGRKGSKPPESCISSWNKKRKRDGSRTWERLENDVWKLFREARGDDW